MTSSSGISVSRDGWETNHSGSVAVRFDDFHSVAVVMNRFCSVMFMEL